MKNGTTLMKGTKLRNKHGVETEISEIYVEFIDGRFYPIFLLKWENNPTADGEAEMLSMLETKEYEIL